MTFAFTFGVGSPLAKYFVELDAPDELSARSLMICMFSRHWSHVYPRAEFEPQIERYGLQRLDVNLQCGIRLGTNLEDIPLEIYRRAYGGAA